VAGQRPQRQPFRTMEANDEMILRQRRAGWFVRSPGGSNRPSPTASPQGAAFQPPESEARAEESPAPNIPAATAEMMDDSEAAGRVAGWLPAGHGLPFRNNSRERPLLDSMRMGAEDVDDDVPPGVGPAAGSGGRSGHLRAPDGPDPGPPHLLAHSLCDA